MINRILTGSLLGLLLATSAAADDGTISFNTQLRKLPAYGAASLQSVAKGTEVTIEQRKGVWFKVKTKGAQGANGWVRRFDVRLSGQVPSKRAGESSGLGSLFGGFLGGKKEKGNATTATLGIRGLDASDLNIAAARIDANKALDAFRASSDGARRSASVAGLTATELDYLGGESSGGSLFDW